MSNKWVNQGIIDFRFALISQKGYCGNIGTSEVKNFTILSSAKSNLLRMIQVANQMNINMICSRSIQETIQKIPYQIHFKGSNT